MKVWTLVFLVLALGCATNGTTFHETRYENGMLASTLDVEHRTRVGPFTRAPENANNLKYGADGGILLGSTAAGLEGMDPQVLLQAMQVLAPLLIPYLAPSPEPPQDVVVGEDLP